MGSHKAIKVLGYHGQERLYVGGKLLGSGKEPSVEVEWGRPNAQISLKDELSTLDGAAGLWAEKY